MPKKSLWDKLVDLVEGPEKPEEPGKWEHAPEYLRKAHYIKKNPAKGVNPGWEGLHNFKIEKK